MKYAVSWHVTLEAETPEQAAEKARALQLDPRARRSFHDPGRAKSAEVFHVTPIPFGTGPRLGRTLVIELGPNKEPA